MIFKQIIRIIHRLSNIIYNYIVIPMSIPFIFL